MSAEMDNRTVALAGLYQSVDLITQIAWQGGMDQTAFEASVGSIFKLDANSFAEVYGGVDGVRAGLKVIRAELGRETRERTAARTRYAIMLLHLERKLRRSSRVRGEIRNAIEAARQQLLHFELTHINVISQLADIYQRFIATLGARIMVHGDQLHLSNPDNAKRIRALLLAGIRAAVLWRQAGGNRWRLLLGRQALLRDVETLLADR